MTRTLTPTRSAGVPRGTKPQVCRTCKKRLPPDHTGRRICAECVSNPKMVEVPCSKCGAPTSVVADTLRRKKGVAVCAKCNRASNAWLRDEPAPPTGKTLSPAERELAGRMLARKYLIPFVLRHDPNYLVGWFHKDLAARLERFVRQVEAGESPRLLLQVPPRAGKSRLTSVEFPAWVLGKHPEWEIIAASYAVSLPVEFSRSIRDRLRDEMYKVTFTGTELSADSQSAESWRTTKKGGFLAAGVGGPLTGRGCHILVVDDPHKNMEESESAAMRESVWRWFTSTAYTRLAPGGGALVIQTRWHLDDLSGRLEREMREEGGEKWEIVRYPAIATQDERWRKAGEALHPERYPVEALRRIEKAVGPRVWNALYQQNPVADEGAYFQADWFRLYDQPPELMTVFNAWDLAIGQKQTNDWTVGVKAGLDTNGNLYVLDVVRGRFDSAQIADQILDMWVSSPGTQECGIEEGQIKHAIGPYLERRVQERRVFDFHSVPMKTGRQDKPARARTLQGLMQRSMVFFPANAPWMDKVKEEMLSFPLGQHDDICDAMAHCANLMVAETPPTIDTAPSAKLPALGTWVDRLKEFVTSDRKSKDWRVA